MVRASYDCVNLSKPVPPFVDSVHAAEMLRLSPEAVLDMIKAGDLRAYGGKVSNPILRSSDIQKLMQELGTDAGEDISPKRVKSATARVQTRLTADSRWSDISESELRDWAARADPVPRQAARKAAGSARDKLTLLLAILDDLE